MNKHIKKHMDEIAVQELMDFLHQKGFGHLKVLVRGQHFVIYSTGSEGDKFNRVRLSHISSVEYQLGIANHMGRWEATPFTGTLSELMQLLTEQFGFVLEDY